MLARIAKSFSISAQVFSQSAVSLLASRKMATDPLSSSMSGNSEDFPEASGEPQVIFVEQINPTTGKREWAAVEAEYSYEKELFASAYGDMLHDYDRNDQYYLAIQKAMAKRPGCHVLDVGTGTGLLAMMAVKSGAGPVTACEVFPPMQQAAAGCMAANGYSDRIKLVKKRSTDLTVGPDGDLPERADVCTSELLDTELIGEGAIESMQHAMKHLMKPDCQLIPGAATVYAQIVSSPTLWSWHSVENSKVGRYSLNPLPENERGNGCVGAAGIPDIQADQIADYITPLTDPIKVLHFDWKNVPECEDGIKKLQEIEATATGDAHAIIMWWVLHLDDEIDISTAPNWAGGKDWRDHWMQAVFFLPKSLPVSTNEKIHLTTTHDNYTIWFDVATDETKQMVQQKSSKDDAILCRPVCTCGTHMVWNHHRIWMINDTNRTMKYEQALKRAVTGMSNANVVTVSDGSILAFAAANDDMKDHISSIHTFEPTGLSRNLVERLLKYNNIRDRVHVIRKAAHEATTEDFNKDKIDLLMAEPYFYSGLLPWHSLYFWYVRRHLDAMLSPTVKVVPSMARLRCAAVQFKHLHKTRIIVQTACGFNVAPFDELTGGVDYDVPLTPHNVWEYETTLLSEPHTLMGFDFTSPIIEDHEETLDVSFLKEGSFHGLVLWMDYDLDEEATMTTGLRDGNKPNYHKQAVKFVRVPISVTSDSVASVAAKFTAESGEMEVSFKVT